MAALALTGRNGDGFRPTPKNERLCVSMPKAEKEKAAPVATRATPRAAAKPTAATKGEPSATKGEPSASAKRQEKLRSLRAMDRENAREAAKRGDNPPPAIKPVGPAKTNRMAFISNFST